MVYQSIVEAIGDTPLLRIDPAVHGLKHIELYAKLEYMNPFGSVKDRTAKAILEGALEDAMATGKTVIESSSGNTAKALAVLCSIHGVKYKTFSNRLKVADIRMILQIMGSEIEEFRGVSDCPDFNDPMDPVTRAVEIVKQHPDDYFFADQYFNERNPGVHHDETAKEIVDDLGTVDYFAGFLGTVGTTVGVGRYLRERNADAQVIGIAAEDYNHVPGGRSLSELSDVGFFKNDFYNQILSGTTAQAIDGLLELNRRCGMLCGPTSGLTYHALVTWLRSVDSPAPSGRKRTCVFIAADRMESYTAYIKKYRPEIFAQSAAFYPRLSSVTEEAVNAAGGITPEELSARLTGPEAKPLLIDTRGNFAYKVGHVQGSMNIVDQLFTDCIEQGEMFPKNSQIVLICGVGSMSKRYAAFLGAQGYDVTHLEGGVMNWKSHGLPLTKLMETKRA